MTQTALLLFAHGSRDPVWREPFEQVLAQVKAQHPGPSVLAFLEFMQPSLPEALESLVAQGVRKIRVLPLFLAKGHHMREDLPELLRAFSAAHPEITIDAQDCLGENPVMQTLIARWAMDLI